MAKTVDIEPSGSGQHTVIRDEAPVSEDVTERAFADVLAEVVGVDTVALDANFFDDLGADSMLMARFCARVRKREDLPSVSIKDVYRNPTIKKLVATLGDRAPATAETAVIGEPPPKPVSRAQYLLCGALQLLTFLAYNLVAALVIAYSYKWLYSAGSHPLNIYLRAVVLGAVGIVALLLVPIAAKWILIGRWKPGQIRLWSLAYVRFWIVRTLIRSSPLLLLIGGRSRSSTTSPLYSWYLRALGAKIGRGVAIYSRNVPVCTDLLTLADGAVIRKDTFFNCYRARAGMIEIGPVTLGKDAHVGEMSVLDIDTELGDGGQLGHASSLHRGQSVPAGQRWHGSPAQYAGEARQPVAPIRCGSVRRFFFGLGQLLNIVLVYVPAVVGGVALLFMLVPQVSVLLEARPEPFTSLEFYRDALVASFLLLFGVGLAGLLFVVTVPRLLNVMIKPGKAYRLYGFHYWVHRTIARATNVRFFVMLFGDSSFIVHYLQALGYRLKPVVQTGCNFGMEFKHETPFASRVGSGTIIADGLSIVNAEFTNTSFSVTPTSIGRQSFLGNHIVYPAGSRAGDNTLLATKVMIPVDGSIRASTGLLGSPSFEIPRSVQRDTRFDHLKQPDELRRRLARKNRYDIRTMGVLLLTRWLFAFVVTVVAWFAADFYNQIGALSIAASGIFAAIFSFIYFSVVERAANGFRRLTPQYCSIYDRYFWWHERYWKLSLQPRLVDGTPFKPLVWRMLGARVGKRLFDDGALLMEKTMISIGDDCVLNSGARLQCHSQEDGTFKSDRIQLGSGCTVGTNALVHYGGKLADGAELAPESFLMKGEEVPKRALWAGNPARTARAAYDLSATR